VRLAHELVTAARIQRGLLLPAPPRLDGYRLEAFLETCHEVGGDLFDFHLRADGKLVFLLGDVSGKGMGAALLMSSFLASARVLYDTCSDPGELATRLGAILHRTTDPAHFVTGFVGCLEPSTGAMHYVNAGHPSAMLALAGSLRELESTGVPFGLVADFRYQAKAAELRPGEVLALFSDGIPEAQRGGEFFEEDRLRRLLLEAGDGEPLDALCKRMVGQVDAFLAGQPRSDDLTLLLIRREGAPSV
jgi:sigma-B regulation protein RsbU (phosphoserine phosphatase)